MKRIIIAIKFTSQGMFVKRIAIFVFFCCAANSMTHIAY